MEVPAETKEDKKEEETTFTFVPPKTKEADKRTDSRPKIQVIATQDGQRTVSTTDEETDDGPTTDVKLSVVATLADAQTLELEDDSDPLPIPQQWRRHDAFFMRMSELKKTQWRTILPRHYYDIWNLGDINNSKTRYFMARNFKAQYAKLMKKSLDLKHQRIACERDFPKLTLRKRLVELEVMTDVEEQVATTVELETITNAFKQRSTELFNILQTPEGNQEMSNWTFVQNASQAWLMEQGLRDEVTRRVEALKQEVIERRKEKHDPGQRRSQRIYARTHPRGNQ